jgi:hypothetical protein
MLEWASIEDSEKRSGGNHDQRWSTAHFHRETAGIDGSFSSQDLARGLQLKKDMKGEPALLIHLPELSQLAT